jgi:hypothetical protein
VVSGIPIKELMPTSLIISPSVTIFKQRWVLEEGTVCGIWVNDQLGAGQILLQLERVGGVEDDVGFNIVSDIKRFWEPLSLNRTSRVK